MLASKAFWDTLLWPPQLNPRHYGIPSLQRSPLPSHHPIGVCRQATDPLPILGPAALLGVGEEAEKARSEPGHLGSPAGVLAARMSGFSPHTCAPRWLVPAPRCGDLRGGGEWVSRALQGLSKGGAGVGKGAGLTPVTDRPVLAAREALVELVPQCQAVDVVGVAPQGMLGRWGRAGERDGI